MPSPRWPAGSIQSERGEGIRPLLEARVARLDDASAGPESARLLNELARSYLFGDRVDEADWTLDRGLRIAERLVLEPAIAELFATKSWATGLQGRHRESMVLAEGSIKDRRAQGMVTTQLRAMHESFRPARQRANHAADTRWPMKGVELAERVGHISWAAALAGNESLRRACAGRVGGRHLSRRPAGPTADHQFARARV